ncbi:PTS-dependent dihydroxyacetone kinase, ADP-binding subunit DhaL [Oceanobacillus picturae]|uniref:phosphoenolpyruvate--glycerone phosphotransferase n=1 Tax=Oceanobacillus picturae TaxID=171693 RepID=A0A0U9HGB5_9BACI|nr:dihydroxyacetone kinase subunit DhaL [Oceanobacillus picturae]GAQ19092.1 PTS-dependent dihydroxyacetone kinase, ADP-binding subunit DhaL [Oceanobacillus picturae]
MELDVQLIVDWMKKTNEKMQENKPYLTTLDQPIGDGDHGINMARGFQEVENKVTKETYETPADVLKDVAMTLMSKVGGASGPLFGTAFLKLSTAVKGSETISYEAFVNGIEQAVAGVKQRGKAEAGEKTMVDVWYPVSEALTEEQDFSAEVLSETAKQAMENTKDMLATKGRAAYFKDKSQGHIDPGSASSFYLFEALSDVLKERA